MKMFVLNFFTIAFIIIISKCALADKLFNVQGKVALVTGGSRGIGLAIAEELLKSGVKGITLVNVNVENGKTAAKALNSKYGYGKVIFIPADVSNLEQFEVAFKISVHYWKRLDIVVNNAGVLNENDLKLMIDTNVIGTLHGVLLGFKYMSEGKGRAGGVIINVASVFGVDPIPVLPIYSATKNFIIGLSMSLGHQVYYDHNKIRVVTLCPGVTATDMVYNVLGMISNNLNPDNKAFTANLLKNVHIQPSNKVGEALVYIAEEGNSGSVWVAEDDQPPYEIEYPDRKSMQKEN